MNFRNKKIAQLSELAGQFDAAGLYGAANRLDRIIKAAIEEISDEDIVGPADEEEPIELESEEFEEIPEPAHQYNSNDWKETLMFIIYVATEHLPYNFYYDNKETMVANVVIPNAIIDYAAPGKHKKRTKSLEFNLTLSWITDEGIMITIGPATKPAYLSDLGFSFRQLIFYINKNKSEADNGIALAAAVEKLIKYTLRDLP